MKKGGPLRPFVCAGEGIVYAIRTQRHFRFHLLAMCYALWLSALAELTGTQWALIFLCCALVLALELLNTALEALCDRVTADWDPLIKAAKDAAAGAVLIAALASVAVALALFSPWLLRGGLWLHRGQLAGMLIGLLPGGLFVRGRKKRKGKSRGDSIR